MYITIREIIGVCHQNQPYSVEWECHTNILGKSLNCSSINKDGD